MALQTQTFTYGSFTSNDFNKYVLELTLTENSVDEKNNTSSVDYELVLKSGSGNRFEGRVDSALSLNGVEVASNSEKKYLDYNSSWTLLSGTATVAHNANGSLNMPIAVGIDTAESNQYSPADTTVNWVMPLTQINLGCVYIANASGVLEKHLVYIHNGTAFEKYVPYIHDGSNWQRH